MTAGSSEELCSLLLGGLHSETPSERQVVLESDLRTGMVKARSHPEDKVYVQDQLRFIHQPSEIITRYA